MKRHLLIETPTLLLRRFIPADAPKVFRMSREEGMRTWLPSQAYRDEAHAASVLSFLIAQYDTSADPREVPLVLGVQLKATGDLVGHVGLSPFGASVEIGFAVQRRHQRKGFAAEAVGAMCAWAADEFGLPTILGVTAARNIASQRVLLRAGFARKIKRLMDLQGVVQPVVIFEWSRPGVEPGSAKGPDHERGRRAVAILANAE